MTGKKKTSGGEKCARCGADSCICHERLQAFAADERGWYMGANIGSAKAKDADASDISAKFARIYYSQTTVDNTDTDTRFLPGINSIKLGHRVWLLR